MEIWHEIPEYTGLYEASSNGRIRSVEGRTAMQGKVGALSRLAVCGKCIQRFLNEEA